MSRLLAAGADPNLANISGFTALDVSLGAARRTLEAVTTHLTDPALLQVGFQSSGGKGLFMSSSNPFFEFPLSPKCSTVFFRVWKLLPAVSPLTSCLLFEVVPALAASPEHPSSLPEP